jgi:hypothetical protein
MCTFQPRLRAIPHVSTSMRTKVEHWLALSSRISSIGTTQPVTSNLHSAAGHHRFAVQLLARIPFEDALLEPRYARVDRRMAQNIYRMI